LKGIYGKRVAEVLPHQSIGRHFERIKILYLFMGATGSFSSTKKDRQEHFGME
jgi:hypothetical protein